MEEYMSNSNRSKRKESDKQEEKKIEKVVSGRARQKKKSGMSKFADAFVSDDAGNIKSYIVDDVLIPFAKNAISDLVKGSIEMLLFGKEGRPGKKSGIRADRVSYGSCYGRDRDRDRRDYSRRATYEYDDIVVDDRADAQRILDSMDDILDEYGTVSIGDLYDLVGITGSHTDNKYGWTDLRTARAERVRDGYLIKLPRALPLD